MEEEQYYELRKRYLDARASGNRSMNDILLRQYIKEITGKNPTTQDACLNEAWNLIFSFRKDVLGMSNAKARQLFA